MRLTQECLETIGEQGRSELTGRSARDCSENNFPSPVIRQVIRNHRGYAVVFDTPVGARIYTYLDEYTGFLEV